jgi:hypothetical protein
MPAIVVVMLAVVAGVAVAPAATDEGPRNIIVIGWDGCQRNHLHELLTANQLPNLAALAKDGALVDIDVTSGATDTKAGWAQILTGCRPEVTGVYSDKRYQAIPEGFTVFERLKAALGGDIITMAIVGGGENTGADAPMKIPYDQWYAAQTQRILKKAKTITLPKPKNGEQIIVENGQKFIFVPAKPWYNAAQHMDLWINGLGSNARVGQTALEEIGLVRDKRFFAFLHFDMPEAAGHKYGENSQEYSDAIKSDDEWLGKIVARLRELNLYDKTLVYVTSDHGFDEGLKTHGYAPYVFLGTNDAKVTRNGIRSDLAPTILKRFGVDPTQIVPPMDGIAMDMAAPDRKAPPAPAGKAKAKHGKHGKAGAMPPPPQL